MKEIKVKNLPALLRSMAEYVEDCMLWDDDIKDYFNEIADTGLFHDSEGKIVDIKGESIYVSNDY